MVNVEMHKYGMNSRFYKCHLHSIGIWSKGRLLNVLQEGGAVFHPLITSLCAPENIY